MTKLQKAITLILILTFLFVNTTASKILAVIPTSSISHQLFFRPLWRELAQRGHEVVLVTTDPMNENIRNLQEISMSETYKFIKKDLDFLINNSIYNWIKKWPQSAVRKARFQMNLPQVQKLLHNNNTFDLLIVEHLFAPWLGLQHHFKCPTIGVMSFDAMPFSHEAMGNPVHAKLYPFSLIPYQDGQSFLDKIWLFIVEVLLNHAMIASDTYHELVKSVFGNDTPSPKELLQKTDMLFVNAHPLFNAIRPYAPNTISLAGGLHINPEKALPKELKEFLDGAVDGAIYFSLGTNVKTKELPLKFLQTVMATLAQTPYKILWKFEDVNLPGKPDNIMISRWVPQQDILRHKNVKAFITQCGMQSLDEALYTHQPMVLMPFFADQQANAQKAKDKGIGVVVNKDNLNVKDFKAAIMDVVQNPIYRNTIKRLAEYSQDNPMRPLERAVWWTEYVIRHKGAQHLKGPRLPWYQYYYMDVIAFLAIIGLLLLVLLIILIRFCIKRINYSIICGRIKKLQMRRIKQQ